ncbi:hypothetical protein T4B_959, partial [Trichinella pseudospiralis]
MLRYNVNQKCFITEAFLLAIQGYPCFLRALKGTVSYISNNFERPLEEWRWRLLKEFKLFALYFFMFFCLLKYETSASSSSSSSSASSASSSRCSSPSRSFEIAATGSKHDSADEKPLEENSLEELLERRRSIMA